MTKRLPKELFAILDRSNGEEDPFLLAGDRIDQFASMGEKKIVGTYKLMREDVVTAVTKISQRKVRSR